MYTPVHFLKSYFNKKKQCSNHIKSVTLTMESLIYFGVNMKYINYLTITLISLIILSSCEDNDTKADDAVSLSGTYTLSSVTVHSGDDCSADDGSSGLCFPDTELSEADCNETGVGFCMDENGDGIEGIELEDDCTGDNDWINMGWNLWMVFFDDLYITFSDDGTWTDSDGLNGTYTIDGTTLTSTDSDGEVTTATVSGNTITTEIVDSITSDANCANLVFTNN